MSSIHAHIHQLTAVFAESVIEFIRASSREGIAANAKSSAAAPRRRGSKAVRTPLATKAKAGSGSDKTVDRILYVLKKNPKGLRSEVLRAKLGLDKAEL